MLGDTGANALGAALGCAAVLIVGDRVRDVIAVVLLALTLASEVVSFSRVIAAVAPLRALDRLGRLRPEEAG
jgi:UDP-N-acetylmuramyl pentapeptide phosphotransferase/UDP-N-acetylglucosamine-1-phosphate transferase